LFVERDGKAGRKLVVWDRLAHVGSDAPSRQELFHLDRSDAKWSIELALSERSESNGDFRSNDAAVKYALG